MEGRRGCEYSQSSSTLTLKSGHSRVYICKARVTDGCVSKTISLGRNVPIHIAELVLDSVGVAAFHVAHSCYE
jgi:hypothetical protein